MPLVHFNQSIRASEVEEYIPTQDTVTPIADVAIQMESETRADISGLSEGRYEVYVAMTPHPVTRRSDDAQSIIPFMLRGSVNVADGEGLSLIESDLEEETNSRRGKAALMTFDVDGQLQDQANAIVLRLDPQSLSFLEENFSRTRLIVKRELKHSIFD